MLNSTRSLAIATLLLLSPVCQAYESDVHYGLTKWLALQAGYLEWQATAIAIGDQRVDSGDMQYIEILPTYACLSNDKEESEVVRLLHFPSETDVPAASGQRAVIPNSRVARNALEKSETGDASQAIFRLYLMGVALHPLQDSWAHQGQPDVPTPFGQLASCSSTLAWGNPRDRGGWNSHKADLAHAWPADTIAMAEATYVALQRMPDVGGVKRSPKAWKDLTSELDGFLHALNKTELKKWFLKQGIDDVSFLEGISLPDGPEQFDLRWPGRKLPPLSTLQSTQHHIDQGLLDAMSDFFMKWASSTDFDALAADVAVPIGVPKLGAESESVVPADKMELAARLRAWRIRDHGRVADLAHSAHPLTAAQRSVLLAIAKGPRQLAVYSTPAEAYFPLLVKGPEPSPLLGFILYPLADSTAGNARVIAVTKFRHAPYDTVEVLGERVGARWRIVAIRAIVDH